MKEQRMKRRKDWYNCSRSIPYRLSYIDLEEADEFEDMCNPRNMGRRRPRHDEWGCYIEDEQMLHIENLKCGLLTDISEFTKEELHKNSTLGNLSGIKHGPQLK